jgi:hypothetical protein
VSDPEVAARLAALRDLLSGAPSEDPGSPKVRSLVRSLQSLAESQSTLSLVDPSVRAVLLALRDADALR